MRKNIQPWGYGKKKSFGGHERGIEWKECQGNMQLGWIQNREKVFVLEKTDKRPSYAEEAYFNLKERQDSKGTISLDKSEKKKKNEENSILSRTLRCLHRKIKKDGSGKVEEKGIGKKNMTSNINGKTSRKLRGEGIGYKRAGERIQSELSSSEGARNRFDRMVEKKKPCEREEGGVLELSKRESAGFKRDLGEK